MRIGEAMHMIRRGDADVMVAGGAEAAITPFAYREFLLDEGNEFPQRRPGDR
jgi:3-oxoacyl-[acyl-carrier-protein] synthase II